MTLRHLWIFVAVFRYSNITKAAHELHLAQPSVSLAIKEMENYYGVPLFERIGRHIEPSESAKELYQYAVHVLSEVKEIEDRIRNWDQLGKIRIGTSITIGTYILPVILKQFQDRYPKLQIKVTVAQSEVIETQILNNQIDIGLIETQPVSEDVVSIPFVRDSMCAIVANDHPLTKQSTVTLKQLARYPFLMREKGSAGREILEACFSLLGLQIEPAWESVSTQALVRAVSEGFGVAVLPLLLIQKNIDEKNVTKIPFENPLTRNLNIVYYKNKLISKNLQTFIDLSKAYGLTEQI